MPSPPSPTVGLSRHFFRHAYGQLTSRLTRRFGLDQLERAEDAVQTALERALATWPRAGLPVEPVAWLYRVAERQLLDQLRAIQAQDRLRAVLSTTPHAGEAPQPETHLAGELSDELLPLLFACCDESLPRESQLVLCLKTLCGFGVHEIAARLFMTEAHVYKRLGRARERMRSLGHRADLTPIEAARRLDSVLRVVYLLFNEGFDATRSPDPARDELCDEALRLALLLTEHPTGRHPSTYALVALLYLHAARREARRASTSRLLLLEQQDRTKFDWALIAQGFAWLDRASTGTEISRYHLEAGIAAEHCIAPSFEATRWSEIAELYGMLERLEPSPLWTLNRAIALGQAEGPERALALLDSIAPPPWLQGYYLWDAARAELLRKQGDHEAARHHLERALARAPTEAERDLLRERLASWA